MKKEISKANNFSRLKDRQGNNSYTFNISRSKYKTFNWKQHNR